MNTFIKGKKIELTVGEILFYCYWIVMCFAKAIGWYEGMTSYNLCLVFSLSCILLKTILEKHSVLELVLIAGTVVLGGLVYLYSGEKAPLIYIFLMIGMLHISVKRVFYLGLTVWLACFAYRALLGITGLSRGMALVHEKLGLGPILRWSFGYPHPNVMHITYAVLAAFILYLTSKRGRSLRKLLLLLFVGNCCIFLYSISYTGFLLTTLCLVIFYYFVTRKKFSRLEKTGMLCLLPACILFSILGPLLTGEGSLLEEFGPFLNRLLNSRFNASRVYLWNGIHLFGCRPEAGNFALDCSYVYILIKDGLIFALLVGGIYLSLIYHCMKKGEWKKMALILAFSIAGISEPFLFNSSFKNLIFVFAGEFVYEVLRSPKMAGSYKIGMGWAEKTEVFSVPDVSALWEKIQYVYYKKKGTMIIVGVLAGLAAAVVYAAAVPRPDSIFVGVGNTDCGQREEVYLDRNELPDNFNSLIYEYQGADYPLYEFDGNTVRLERVRDLFSFWLLGSMAGGVLMLAVSCAAAGREKSHEI